MCIALTTKKGIVENEHRIIKYQKGVKQNVMKFDLRPYKMKLPIVRQTCTKYFCLCIKIGGKVGEIYIFSLGKPIE